MLGPTEDGLNLSWGSGHSTKPATAQDEFGQHSQARGGILERFCADFSRDPGGSLPAQDNLWFSDLCRTLCWV